MLQIDFTEQKQPFQFIRDVMIGYTEEEIQQAHENYCLYLNLILKIYNDNVNVD